MRAIATVCLSGDLRSKLEAVARAGYDGVEIFENDLLSFDGTPSELRTLCERLGLKIVAFQPFRDFEGMPEPQRTRNFERAERKFDLMEELGTDFLLVCSNVSPQCIDDLDRVAADLRELAERAARRGLRIGFEALAWGRHISDYRDAWEAVKRADHPALGVVLDSFHILSRGLELDTMASIPADKIAFVQIADAPLMDMDVLQWSRHFRCFPGQGRLPLREFMQALVKTGYEGPLSLEIFNDAFRAAPTEATALDGLRSLIWLEQLAEGAAWSLAEPPASAYSGIHFIEFTLDEESAAPLGEFLSALGFRHIGRHRSKNVELWRQGDIHLVLNFETDSFAHTFRLLHGTSVCAVGFRVGDLDAAMARAKLYKAPVFHGPVGEGEMEIPALRGIEGSLVYLVNDAQARDVQWKTDFMLFEDGDVDDAGLLNVDHLSYVLPPTQLLGWLLFHRTVFGFDAGSEHEIADPRGMVVSQAAISPDSSIRIPLTVSSARDTLPGRFLSEHQGGVQQIAFATGQIFDTIDAMRARGLPMLRIPANYYDDLAARFDLDDDLLEAMRSRNILYDRNDDGEFFHAYTETFMGRFFFEVVERRGNYTQFGAVNAPIRLAAQASQKRPVSR
ncbi:sugar phosphate isomerase/epimerase and 4-hydroxyphenylpyruvate domain-containing protein [Halomonas sp. McH1-25]|uniref:bifunctional sugar phosphate isomerase/epimerase/4-hydroxyphenylpyruvate dioxygenase family protein n=1 Tax=unclassified Halomonas TaxID=2609666 RepID=UPI001EF7367F|nr:MULTISPECIES: sugar phosphate isomerase/epimerase and 4-hydroxyphenylpyruvate domain-containing protein [unclassified Halomonas]MCG7601530.1 sugar phosphate isomerase/epimerase and 4-hydroxyphenylpyruvate domain-containing protein [Halomonas sp. McH1-25]MCP1343328.1 sugar phosphate isomerase/epimerase and 4-hydroxyphenylpyruvate domain-containing protein [Halomonas sp. FL8]MCP1362585.1 sugar phosphate isomerase/epimerase and 4-hydroxyphenylpyruvate domain-containing protein [Halomonas sp. BBD